MRKNTIVFCCLCSFLTLHAVEPAGNRLATIKNTQQPPKDSTLIARPLDQLMKEGLANDNIIEIDVDEDDGGGSSTSSLLGASRDVYSSQMNYNLSPFRFQTRGLDNDYSEIYFNGLPISDTESGFGNFSLWGGLNDVMRLYTTAENLNPLDGAYGGITGATDYNTFATAFRKQNSVSYGASNRNYRNRIMATYASGLTKSGWAAVASFSTRMAESGYNDGTPYQAYGYFLSVGKKMRNHALNFTVLGAPTKRGMSSAVTQEIYDLTGNYQYNPNWGYQNGEVRNARIRYTHMPIGLINYVWDIDKKSKLNAGFMVQAGRNGTTALDWFEGNDPRPDYYRKLPSYWNTTDADFNKNPSAEVANLLTNNWRNNDVATTQLNWDGLYQGNYTANAFKGTDRATTPWQAINILKEYRNDQTTFNFNTNYSRQLTKKSKLTAGINAKVYKGEFYQTVVDALGADYYLNIDKYVLGSTGATMQTAAFNLLETDAQRMKKVGDKFGYDYSMNQNDAGAWAQYHINLKKIDFWAAGNVGYTQFWRTGHYQNGRYQQNSYGTSKTYDFISGSAKGGITYKISGNSYLTATGGYSTRPPLFKNTFLNARYNDNTFGSDYYKQRGMDNLTEKIVNTDLSYNFRNAYMKIRASVFYTQTSDVSEIRTLYNEGAIDPTKTTPGALVQYITQGIGQQMMGAELGISYKITPTLTVEAAGTLSQYVYNRDPLTAVITDYDGEIRQAPRRAFLTGYNVAGTPQNAGSVTLSYRSPQYWFVGVTANVADGTYIDMNYDRRTREALDEAKAAGTTYAEQYALQSAMLEQEKFPTAYTLDLFAGYSKRIGSGILGINGNISNLTNNIFKTGGYEQSRVKGANVSNFPNKYYYSYGLNFFAQVYYRF